MRQKNLVPYLFYFYTNFLNKSKKLFSYFFKKKKLVHEKEPKKN